MNESLQEISDYLKPIAAEIAASIGWVAASQFPGSEFPARWILAPPTIWSADRKSGACIAVAAEDIGTSKGKFVFTGLVPSTAAERPYMVGCGLSIRVSISRGTAAAAAELTRRLIPGLTAKLEEALQTREANVTHANAVVAVKDRMSKAFGVNFDAIRTVGYLSMTSGGGEVQVNSPRSVTIKLQSISVQMAEEIGAVVKKYARV